MLSSFDNKIDVSSLENGIYILMINKNFPFYYSNEGYY